MLSVGVIGSWYFICATSSFRNVSSLSWLSFVRRSDRSSCWSVVDGSRWRWDRRVDHRVLLTSVRRVTTSDRSCVGGRDRGGSRRRTSVSLSSARVEHRLAVAPAIVRALVADGELPRVARLRRLSRARRSSSASRTSSAVSACSAWIDACSTPSRISTRMSTRPSSGGRNSMRNLIAAVGVALQRAHHRRELFGRGWRRRRRGGRFGVDDGRGRRGRLGVQAGGRGDRARSSPVGGAGPRRGGATGAGAGRGRRVGSRGGRGRDDWCRRSGRARPRVRARAGVAVCGAVCGAVAARPR